MSLRPLLKGETIKIDNHHAGQRIALDDEGLHMHKRFNESNKKRGRVDVIIKLNDDIEVEGYRGQDAATIEREIRAAFANRGIRERFLKSAKKALTELSTVGITERIPNEVVKEKINNILIGVTEYFGVSRDNIADLLYRNQEEQEVAFRYVDDEHREVYARVDLEDPSIALTHDDEMIRHV